MCDVVRSGRGDAFVQPVTARLNPLAWSTYLVAALANRGRHGATSEPVDTTFTATKVFDFGVASTTTGDLWQGAIGYGASGAGSISPVFVLPGQSITILVDITLTRNPGDSVLETIRLDDSGLWSLIGFLAPNANTVATIAYSYEVGSGFQSATARITARWPLPLIGR